MARYEVECFFSNQGPRNDVRMRVVDAFAMEIPGEGKGNFASQYTYYVETLADGRRIFLVRPAWLHNGFDFVVNIEGVNFNPNGRRRTSPSHDDMLDDLSNKKRENQQMYRTFLLLLEQVYNCEPVDEAMMNRVSFNSGLPTELILKTMKWLFIEQDIRYWNYSGREMLWNKICSI